jgi:SAM-dependent methyltransferase
MVDGDCSFMIDAATVFFDYFRIEGWFHSETDTLFKVQLANASINGISGNVGLPHAGVADALGPNKGFCISALIERTPELELVFHTVAGREIKTRVLDLCNERKRSFEGRALLHHFIDAVNARPGSKLLDIGGRARSGVEYSKMFHQAECTVLDILPGDNVDVVGDAHVMSNLFPPCSFDAIFSSSVFEHLLMPWVVASEMANVLRMGGMAYIATHQTLGMHDLPWDFWRFSDTAWDGLFNRYTGFEIIGRALDNPQYITPHFWRPEQGERLERAVGYVGSAVLVRKISNARSGWSSVELASLIGAPYPETEEPRPAWLEDPANRGIH